MSDKALFVYLLQDDSDFLWYKKNYQVKRIPSLGLQYLCAVLKNKKIETEIIDQSLNYFTPEELSRKIKLYDYKFIGFYSCAILKNKVLRFIHQIRKDNINIPILTGGPGFIIGKDYLQAGADIICNGEGENTISQIVDHLNRESNIEDVKGISYFKNGEMITNTSQKLIENIDTIPFPDRDKIPIKYYYDYHIFNMRQPHITMIASRGCPYNCSFCSTPFIWERKLRMRTPQNVIEEIDSVVSKYKIRYIGFKDDVFGFNVKWLEKFCNLLTERKYNLKWMAIVHPLSFKENKKKYLSLMWNAGCDTLAFGLQSADPQILKNINRNPQEPAELKETIKIARNIGFLINVELIFGLPGETVETMKDTIKYSLSEINPHYVEFFALSKLEGSEIAEKYKDKDVCSLKEEEIRKWCKYGIRKFYIRPSLIFKNILYVIKYNPRWLFVGLKHLPHILEAIGFKLRLSRK